MHAALLVLALASSSLPAGGAGPDARVVSVRIDAPHAARLARYVEVRAGDVLDPAALRRDVERLHATGAFEDVVVESQPSAGGVDLVFRPVPAPLLDAIVVAGDRVLGPGDVRRITRLRQGDALWPPRLDQAAQAVALALVADGYLEAHVTATARRREESADAVFIVTAGPRARVGRAALEGAPSALNSLLEPLVRPRPGEPFRRAVARGAAEKIRSRLLDLGFWRARAEVHDSYDPTAARVDLSFRVDAGTRGSVEFRGTPPPAGRRRAVTALLREGGLGSDVIEEGRDRIEEDFRQRGYRDVFVSHRLEPRPGGEAIVYVTEPGPRAQVALVSFSGLEDARFASLVGTRASGPLVDRVVDEDVVKVRRFLEEEGFAEARVEADVPPGGGTLSVRFRIRPGPRTTLRALEVEEPSPPPVPVTSRDLKVKVGAPYRARDVAQARDRLLAWYRDAGFLDVDVSPVVSLSDDKTEARVRLTVRPGPRTEIDRIVIAGLETTHPEVVRRELTLKEGEPLGLSDLRESQRRLSALGIFDRVSITEIDPEDVERRSLVVAADEAPRTTIAYGVGYAEQDLARGSIEVTQRNLFGMDRSLTAFARGSFRGNRVLTTFREPYFLGRKLDLFVTGYREEEDREGFDYVRYGGLVQTAFRLARRRALILRFSYENTYVFNVTIPLDEVDRQFRDATASGPSASVVEDTRDDPLDPRRGHFLGADLQFSDAVFGGDSFLKTFLQGSTYRSVHPGVVLALAARLGLAWTLPQSLPDRLPLPYRFFAGGDNTIRGFELDTAGPLEPSTADPNTLVPTGGNALLVGNAELRFDAGKRFSVAVFSDSGNVYPLVSDMSLGDVRYTAGVGLRYRSAFGPIRVDWGYKLNRRPDESASHFHFTIGNAF
jgi:outer membrane protein insertion porin family